MGPTNDRPNLLFEKKLLEEECAYIAGIDEAGRGAWAGPILAAAVVLPLERDDLARHLNGVRDSKKMTPSQRDQWYVMIGRTCLSIGVGRTSVRELDSLGMIAATRLAMKRALNDLDIIPDHLLIDYVTLPDVHIPQTALKSGDSTSLSIAAASVIAKVARDHTMVTLDETYPGYGFASHKGYGTPQHKLALKLLGPCPEHRRSFSPVASLSFTQTPLRERRN